MSIQCDVILRGNATAEHLTALGAALWRWCNHAAGNSGIYHCLDNQTLADLIAGKFPLSSQSSRQTERRGVLFRFRDEESKDRQAAINSLRQDIPARLVEDIVVDGASWNQIN
ncbi:MAG: hypothetical protein L0Y72_15585 [Gemmataceae bacterium]|nr:hypothetical protein [Gemmataceae bacterium]MCI0740468.1 hypothetical protein [Gemmataceae bacterium]